MKKYFLLFLAVGLLACSSDDDNGVQDSIEVWNLTQRQAHIPVNYNLGDVVWTLNMTNQTLQIQNNIQNVNFDAGQFDFSMTSNTLTIEFPGRFDRF